jgi:predicted nucleic acid-binding Zn ribbon protein
VEKVLFPVAVHFKGSGFYSTDYGRGSRKQTGKEGDSATSGDGSGTSETPTVSTETKKSDAKKSDS